MTDITRKRGDTYGDEFIIMDDQGVVVDITGYTFTMAVDPSRAPADSSNNLYQLTGTILDAVNGIVEFAPTVEQANQTPGVYWYDLQQVDAAGRIKTIITGKYIYEQDITK